MKISSPRPGEPDDRRSPGKQTPPAASDIPEEAAAAAQAAQPGHLEPASSVVASAPPDRGAETIAAPADSESADGQISQWLVEARAATAEGGAADAALEEGLTLWEGLRADASVGSRLSLVDELTVLAREVRPEMVEEVARFRAELDRDSNSLPIDVDVARDAVGKTPDLNTGDPEPGDERHGEPQPGGGADVLNTAGGGAGVPPTPPSSMVVDEPDPEKRLTFADGVAHGKKLFTAAQTLYSETASAEEKAAAKQALSGTSLLFLPLAGHEYHNTPDVALVLPMSQVGPDGSETDEAVAWQAGKQVGAAAAEIDWITQTQEQLSRDRADRWSLLSTPEIREKVDTLAVREAQLDFAAALTEEFQRDPRRYSAGRGAWRDIANSASTLYARSTVEREQHFMEQMLEGLRPADRPYLSRSEAERILINRFEYLSRISGFPEVPERGGALRPSEAAAMTAPQAAVCAGHFASLLTQEWQNRPVESLQTIKNSLPAVKALHGVLTRWPVDDDSRRRIVDMVSAVASPEPGVLQPDPRLLEAMDEDQRVSLAFLTYVANGALRSLQEKYDVQIASGYGDPENRFGVDQQALERRRRWLETYRQKNPPRRPS